MRHLYCLVFLVGGLLIQCKANEQARGSSKAPANISFTKNPLIPSLLYYFNFYAYINATLMLVKYLWNSIRALSCLSYKNPNRLPFIYPRNIPHNQLQRKDDWRWVSVMDKDIRLQVKNEGKNLAIRYYYPDF